MTNAVCEYVITGGGYFDFKGRDGLIKLLKKYIHDTHYLVVVVKRSKYTDPLDRLVALRNYAAHDSEQSRNKAKSALGLNRLSSSGAWLKCERRFENLTSKVKELATELESNAPY
jgi:hypothetical protein